MKLMKKIKLIGIPFDFGQELSGVRSAYDHLKKSGLTGRLQKLTTVTDLGEIKYPARVAEGRIDGIKNLKQASAANKAITETLENLDLHDTFLLNVGGDHGMALGTVHGILAQRNESVVIWADAHGDVNTPETSPSGNFHGMPVAFLLGIVKHPQFDWIRTHLLPERLILVGPRDLDVGEIEIIQRYGIQYFSSDDLNRIGGREVMECALRQADPQGLRPIHLSFDVDLFDKYDVYSTGTKVADGPKLKEVFALGAMLGETGRLQSMDLVEFNPEIGQESDVKASTSLILDFLETTLKPVFSEKTFEIKKEFLLKALDKSLL